MVLQYVAFINLAVQSTDSNYATATQSQLSDTLSAIAVAISLATLAWSLYRHYVWNRPKLIVSGKWKETSEYDNYPDPEPSKYWELEIVVVNIGDLETTIQSVFWEFENQEGSRFRIVGARNIDAETFEISTDGSQIPTLGVRLHGLKTPVTISRFTSHQWVLRQPVAPNFGVADVKMAQRGRAAIVWIGRTASNNPFVDSPHFVTSYGPWEHFGSHLPK